MRALARRIEALEETAAPQHYTLLIFYDGDEAAFEEKKRRRLAELPEDAEVTVMRVRWRSPHDDSCDQRGKKGQP